MEEEEEEEKKKRRRYFNFQIVRDKSRRQKCFELTITNFLL
jgi:hypothetical protein